MIPPFSAQASDRSPALDSLLLAIAQEFDWGVDEYRVRITLDRLARRLRLDPDASSVQAEDRAAAIARALDRERFRVAHRVVPEDLLLHRLLDRRRGHPLLLSVVGAEIARRAGIDASPAADGELTFVAVRHGPRHALVDPGCGTPRPQRRLSQLCTHQVAYATLTELSRLLVMHGRVACAIKAAEMRLALPIGTELTERARFELDAVRAQLN